MPGLAFSPTSPALLRRTVRVALQLFPERMDGTALFLLGTGQESAKADQQDADPHQKGDHGEAKYEGQPMPNLRYF